MNTKEFAHTLKTIVAESCGTLTPNRLESHDLNSLSVRTGAPVGMLVRELETGGLPSAGPVYKDDLTGRHTVESRHLDHLKETINFSIVAGIVQRSGTPTEAIVAARHALAKHKDSFTKPKGAKVEFAAFPQGVIQLSRDSAGRYYEGEPDQPGTIRQAIGVAGLGAAAYAAQSYARGRAPGLSPMGALRAGHQANVVTGRKIGSWLKPRVSTMAPAGAGILGSAGDVARKAAEALRLRMAH